MVYAIIGSRIFTDYQKLTIILDSEKETITRIVSGGAKGADTLGARYATSHAIALTVFLPDWLQHGNSAGVIRNKQIVDAADVVIAFWDGKSKGTQHSINYAKKSNKRHMVVIIDV